MSLCDGSAAVLASFRASRIWASSLRYGAFSVMVIGEDPEWQDGPVLSEPGRAMLDHLVVGAACGAVVFLSKFFFFTEVFFFADDMDFCSGAAFIAFSAFWVPPAPVDPPQPLVAFSVAPPAPDEPPQPLLP